MDQYEYDDRKISEEETASGSGEGEEDHEEEDEDEGGSTGKHIGFLLLYTFHDADSLPLSGFIKILAICCQLKAQF